jgi:hypothetical protein
LGVEQVEGGLASQGGLVDGLDGLEGEGEANGGNAAAAFMMPTMPLTLPVQLGLAPIM